MKKGQKVLENLLREEHISGFNRVSFPYNFSNINLIVLGNFHETEAYKQAVIEDLRKKDSSLQLALHQKRGFTRWLPQWKIRDDKGKLFPNLKIKDKKGYICLEEIQTQTLAEAGFSEEDILIGINRGYELRVQSQGYKEIEELAKVFIEKTDKNSPNAWPDTYNTPIIFLFGMEHADDFLPVTMYQQKGERLSFNFIQRSLRKDREKILEEIGFEQAVCLANSQFVRECCNP